MSEHLHNLIFGLAAAFVLPAICFLLGMIWSKLIGGPQDLKFRRWWTTFCLALPFVFLAMMIKRMAADHFEGLQASWFAEPFLLLLVIGLAVLLSAVVVVAMIRLWHTSQS
ncbi:MAG: hypothetical protein ACLPXM_17110 [Terriglobales bacterium]